MKIWFVFFILLLGIGLGLGAPSIAPKYLSSYFPRGFATGPTGVQGTVVRKQAEDDRLLLTISSSNGALLATFQKKITEISLLVDEGDSVTLDVRVYSPFVTDPPILRVKKPDSVSPNVTDPSLENPPTDMVPSTPTLDAVPLVPELPSQDEDEPTVAPESTTESQPLL